MSLKIHLLLRVSLLATACLCLNACAKEQNAVTDEWKTECVGRVQMDLPDRVEFALGFDLKQTKKKEGAGARGYFKNGDGTGEIGYSINEASISVSREGNNSDFLRHKQSFIKERQEDQKKKNGLLDPPPVISNTRKIELPNAFAWSWPNYVDAHLFRADRVFIVRVSKYKEEAAFSEARLQYFLANFSPRAIFELPTQQGICFPYGFIKDDGGKPHYVSVAMRLLDHPDVEIVFQETNADKESPDRLSEYKGSRGHVQNFWSFYKPSQGNKLDGTINHYHDVDLGGFTGIYATATIARPIDPADTTGYRENQEQYSTRVKREMAEGKYPLDYGYMAYYKGDPNKPGEPDLKLSVIRTASRATKVGKTPVTQEELYGMAKKIAASIKRRPMQ